MVAYHNKSNVILIKGSQTRHDRPRIPPYNTIIQQLQDRGNTVTNKVLDNEASAAYKAKIKGKWRCTYQLVSPYMYPQNTAEQAIQNFKAHFLAILAGVDPGLPKNR